MFSLHDVIEGRTLGSYWRLLATNSLNLGGSSSLGAASDATIWSLNTLSLRLVQLKAIARPAEASPRRCATPLALAERTSRARTSLDIFSCLTSIRVQTQDQIRASLGCVFLSDCRCLARLQSLTARAPSQEQYTLFAGVRWIAHSTSRKTRSARCELSAPEISCSTTFSLLSYTPIGMSVDAEITGYFQENSLSSSLLRVCPVEL